MTIIGVAMLFGFFVWLEERRHRSASFPDQPCRACGRLITYRGEGRWLHRDTGSTWDPPTRDPHPLEAWLRNPTTPPPHLAMPTYDPGTIGLD